MKTIAQKHPVLMFLLINFSWTWLFWMAAIPFRGQTLLVMAIVMIGGFGPAIGGILTLGVKNGRTFEMPVKKTATMAVAALVIFALIALRYLAGNIPNYDILAENLTLTTPILLAALAASLVGGWVISSAVSSNKDIRSRMSSMLVRKPASSLSAGSTRKTGRSGWIVFGLLFYPVLILAAWGLASLTGMEVEYPGLWGSPVVEVLPIYALSFGLTALAQGGNEEPGWRGFMQPELQKRFSPLVAALFVAVAWSLWHLPLYLNGFYPGDPVGGMIGGGIFRILLAILLAWFYDRSGGNLFLMIFMHTCFNVMVNFLPTSDLWLFVLLQMVLVVIVNKDKMYRKVRVDPQQAPEPNSSSVGGAPKPAHLKELLD